MSQKPSLPKGTRDFGPIQMMRRNFIFSTIQKVFELYGYQPIETPAMETLDTLLGKYGDEGDKLIFKILNSGDFVSKIPTNLLSEAITPDLSRRITPEITEKALRYDLTVPFARFVVQHRDEITFPFKRYQIQPVWRADRPQKGRYREFYQCDVDVIGSDSLQNETELIRIIDRIFADLGIRVTIKINNRKILAGMAELIGQPERLTDLTVALDKLDKIGIEEVKKEWLTRGITEKAATELQPLLTVKGSNQEIINTLQTNLSHTKNGKAGLDELNQVLVLLANYPLQSTVEVDLTLARGLNYYTGAIIEVKSDDVIIGSICGGGRYDDLTGIFGMPGVSGVGVSFGADRIYDVLEHTEGFPGFTQTSTQVLFMNFGDKESPIAYQLAEELRNSGIRAEVYPDVAKLKKQFQYADQNHIPIVVMIGESELTEGKATVRNMITGLQSDSSIGELSANIRSYLLSL
ncbi:MAG: histidine--tRNA ligase [Bacteroidales bacterium]|nr:histidine--tRNA ligase [Bacteroidales bacterium]MDD3870601.1 histidine--tRNA ligase [Bacteroidales bacterium]MDD4812577.1 histidine--tRNA ligase [Bacteroidales bacterium]